MKFIYLALGLAMLGGIWRVADIYPPVQTHRLDRPAPIPRAPAGTEVITLGGGCFWHMQAILERIPGVLSVTVGYMGGTTKNPTYEQIGGGRTGYTEVARVIFDPKRTDLEKILPVFWKAHRPTGPNSSSGRSVIFYSTDGQRRIAEKSRAEAAKSFSEPIVTEIARAEDFYAAEEYHQDYYKKRGNKACGL